MGRQMIVAIAGSGLKLKRLFRAISAFASILILGEFSASADHASFHYAADRFELDGNVAGPFDGTPDVVDEFDNSTFSPDWSVSFGTASESGGLAHLQNPGVHAPFAVPGIVVERSDISSTTHLADGSGNFSITAIFPMTTLQDDHNITVTLGGNESMAAGIVNAGPNQGFPAGPAGYHLVQFYVTAPPFTPSAELLSLPILESDITGDLFFRLSFDDSTNLVTSEYSLDGGSSFMAPFAPHTFFDFLSSTFMGIHASEVLPPPTATPTPSATSTASETPTATATATATPTFCVGLDVDENGIVQGSTDGVYIFRRLIGLGFIVPTAFRALDDSILDDVSIVANIDALGAGLDVDVSGAANGATDGVYVFRHLLGLQFVVPTLFRALDSGIPTDEMVAANIDALCGGGGALDRSLVI